MPKKIFLVIKSKVTNFLRPKKLDQLSYLDALNLSTLRERFTYIYLLNHWGSLETRSGFGSELSYTENLRKELPVLIKQFSIKKIFDGPCGDFNWMQHFLKTVDVEYIGGDIVEQMIESNSMKYKNENISFIHMDLVKDRHPSADLMICRDCLFHLSFKDIKFLLERFIESNSKYLLTTTHKNKNNSFVNKDIISGDYRMIDLFSPPYNFDSTPLSRIDDWMAPEPEREMCLWSRDQIISLEKSI